MISWQGSKPGFSVSQINTVPLSLVSSFRSYINALFWSKFENKRAMYPPLQAIFFEGKSFSQLMFFLLDLANSVVLLKTQNDGDKEQKALDNKLALTGTFWPAILSLHWVSRGLSMPSFLSNGKSVLLLKGLFLAYL